MIHILIFYMFRIFLSMSIYVSSQYVLFCLYIYVYIYIYVFLKVYIPVALPGLWFDSPNGSIWANWESQSRNTSGRRKRSAAYRLSKFAQRSVAWPRRWFHVPSACCDRKVISLILVGWVDDSNSYQTWIISIVLVESFDKSAGGLKMYRFYHHVLSL